MTLKVKYREGEKKIVGVGGSLERKPQVVPRGSPMYPSFRDRLETLNTSYGVEVAIVFYQHSLWPLKILPSCGA